MQPANLLRINTLDENWSDNDNVLLHACFQLLTDCIEKEGLLTHWDWTADGKAEVKAELETLYAWWQQRVEREQADQFDWIWTPGQHEEDTAMLIRLVQVRGYLWT